MVSVIITTYNSEDHIYDCLLSVMSQSHQDIEVLLYDDCSSDNTVPLAEDILQASGLKYTIHVSDINFGGPAMGRNWGISSAVGNYLCFLDADDLWFSHKLVEQLNFIKNRDVDILGTYALSSKGGIIGTRVGNLSTTTLLIRNRLILSSIMVRKSFIHDNHLLFSEDLNKCGVEDYDFILRCSVLGAKIINLETPLLVYNILEESLSHKDFSLNELRRMNVIWTLNINKRLLSIKRYIIYFFYKLKLYV